MHLLTHALQVGIKLAVATSLVPIVQDRVGILDVKPIAKKGNSQERQWRVLEMIINTLAVPLEVVA